MKRVRAGIWGLSEVAQRVVMPLFQGAEMLAPPDTGLRWNQRPGAILDYQPSAVGVLAAIGDVDKNRVERVAQICTAQMSFTHWRDMLREGELDALLLAKRPEEPLSEIMAEMAQRDVRWLWLLFPPATTADGALALSAQEQLQHVSVWWAQPATLLRAHRVAGQLVAQGKYGEIEHLHLSWPASFASASQTNSAWWEAAQAFNLALHLAGIRETGGTTRILQMAAGKCGNTVSLWGRCANDVNVTIRFGASAPVLPRLEISLSEGGMLVCEAGGQLTHHTAQGEVVSYGSSGWTTGDSGTLKDAYAEDLKRFLARCGELESPLSQLTESNSSLWRSAAHVLQALEGTATALHTKAMEFLPPLHFEHLSPRVKEQIAPPQNTAATLPLGEK